MIGRSKEKQLAYWQKLEEYLKEYGEYYPKIALDFLCDNFLQREPSEEPLDLLAQIYDALDLLPPERNRYLQFAELIGRLYGWNYHILEVGGGLFPSFSRHIDRLQQEHHSSGTITTYDPRLVVSKLGNVQLHKEVFQEEMVIESYNLIVGIMPCEATGVIIKKATQEHKEFFLAMCGCIHGEGLSVPRNIFGSILLDYYSYVAKVYELARKQEPDGFEVIMENSEMTGYPIIRSKKIK